jgi:carbamoyltransferase
VPQRSITGAVAIGVAGAKQNASASLCRNGHLLAACEQERLTRVRNVGLSPGRLPEEAVRAVRDAASAAGPSEVIEYVTAEAEVHLPADVSWRRVDHHRGHASTAFQLSGFDSAVVLVCDGQRDRPTSAWRARAGELQPVEWLRSGASLAGLYQDAAEALGFRRDQAHEVEGLARLGDGSASDRFAPFLAYDDHAIEVRPGWQEILRDGITSGAAGDVPTRAHAAAAFQRRVASLLMEIAQDIVPRLCLGGGLFYNTHLATALAASGVFDEVFTAPNPGNAASAIGPALELSADHPAAGSRVSPFLGPGYTPDAIKATLDNCKLSYEHLDEDDVVDMTAEALERGRLVGWFQGRMEWAHRALGHRSILASPFAPYVLDNLNVYLKHRPRHRAYGLSVPTDRASDCFMDARTSRFMEYEFCPSDAEAFRHILPRPAAALRVQTIDPADDETGRFERLHRAFADRSGTPVLVNTSFNGFFEPMVCSPRDAIRVFFGTGLDLLVMDRFVVRK